MNLKVVFFGTPDFAIPALEFCHINSNLVLCVSQPNKARGRGQEILPSPVSAWALKNSVEIATPQSLKESHPEGAQFKGLLENLAPDLIFVVAYGRIIPTWLLDLPKLGCVNIHASLLPLWRGAAPIQRSIEAGDSVTGVSLQKMVLELDAGDVLLEKPLPIGFNENAFSLSKRLSKLGGELLGELFDNLKTSGKLPPGKSQEPLKVSFAKKIEKSEGLWNPSWTSKQTNNRVRAFFSWPQVALNLPKPFGNLKLIDCIPVKTPLPKNLKHPAVFEDNGHFFLSCEVRAGEKAPDDALVELLEVKPESKKAMPAKAFFSNLKSYLPVTPLMEAK